VLPKRRRRLLALDNTHCRVITFHKLGRCVVQNGERVVAYEEVASHHLTSPHYATLCLLSCNPLQCQGEDIFGSLSDLLRNFVRRMCTSYHRVVSNLLSTPTPL